MMKGAVAIGVLILGFLVWLWRYDSGHSQNEVAIWLNANGLGDLVHHPKIKSELPIPIRAHHYNLAYLYHITHGGSWEASESHDVHVHKCTVNCIICGTYLCAIRKQLVSFPDSPHVGAAEWKGRAGLRGAPLENSERKEDLVNGLSFSSFPTACVEGLGKRLVNSSNMNCDTLCDIICCSSVGQNSSVYAACFLQQEQWAGITSLLPNQP